MSGNNTTFLSGTTVPVASAGLVVDVATAVTWGISFETLMASEHGIEVLEAYMARKFDQNYIQFWKSCKVLKKQKKADVFNEMAIIIYEDFIEENSPRSIDVGSLMRKALEEKFMKKYFPLDSYDELENDVYSLMRISHYPGFLKSSNYKSLVDRIEGPRREDQ